MARAPRFYSEMPAARLMPHVAPCSRFPRLAAARGAAYSCAMSDPSHDAPAQPAGEAASQTAHGAPRTLRLDALHLLVTYRCTYACDHCFVWGSPEQEATMTLAQLRDVIDQAAAAGCSMVYFEGGEPMLAYPVVLAASRHARAVGLEFGVVSNCYWAESLDDALVWLAPFADLGVADLSLSSYACFTEKLENEAHLRNAVLAAQRLGLPMAVLEVGAPAALADLGVACGEPGEIMFKGRASEALACGERLTRPPDTLTSCPYEDFADPGRCHVGCDGNLMPCQGISIGNLWRRSLADILATYDPASLPVVREILAGGPWALAQATGLEPALARYADECHLCYELRCRLRAAGRHPEVLAPDQCYGVNGSPAPDDPS